MFLERFGREYVFLFCNSIQRKDDGMMWKRSELKSRAKAVLKLSYWKAFLVSIILAIAGGSCSSGGTSSYNPTWNGQGGTGPSAGHSAVSSSPFEHAWLILVILLIALVVILAVAAFRIFVGYPLEVGCKKYFVNSTERNFDLNAMGYGFKAGMYLDIVKSMFWRALLNFLWYLLLFIPGIVKSYAYRMVPYLLADNPNLGYKRAVDLSKQMTRGHKFRMFVLDLSFIGWFLLGTLALFIGVLFVLPYYNATLTELYAELRERAIQQSLTSREELRLETVE